MRALALALAGYAAAAVGWSAPRPKMIRGPVSVYVNWAAYDELSDNVELTEHLAMRQLDELLRLRNQGVRFDAYVMDAFWFAKDGGYRTWRARSWPNGPDAWLKKCKANGVRPGLWIGTNTLSGLTPVPEWESSLNAGRNAMCLFDGGFLPHLIETMQIWYNRGVRVYKFDFANFGVVTPRWEGKLSAAEVRTRNEDAFRTALDAFRDRNPDVLLLAYNGFGGEQNGTSAPFRKAVDLRWLEVFDSLYCGDPRPADVPTMNFWRSKDIYSDHMVRRYEENRVPLERIDNTAFMIGTTGTCYNRRTSAWKGMLILSLARGGWVNTYYGNLELLSESDAHWFGKVQTIFYQMQGMGRISTFGGVPGEERPYGFVATSEGGDLYTVVNPGQSVAKVSLPGSGGRLLFHDAGFRPSVVDDSVILGPEQMAVVGAGKYGRPEFDLGIGKDVIIPSEIQPLEARFDTAGPNVIAATMVAPKTGDLRIVMRQFRSDGLAQRTTGGAPPQGVPLGKLLTISVEQGGRALPVDIRYDKAIWSGLSWAAGEVRAKEMKPGAPVTIRCATADKTNPKLQGAVYRVVY